MKIIKPTFYKDFECIAGACPDSCCQGWEVDADADSLDYYKTLSPDLEIKQRIDRVLDKDEFNNTIFTLAPKKRCPFLNDVNLCDMHIAIGGEHTPYTCRTFPRFIYDFGGTREMGINFSCPVASDMIYGLDNSMEFEEELNSDPPTLNDIDAETYFKLLIARKNAYSILQSKDKPVNERLIELLDMAVELQNELDEYTEGGDDISLQDVFSNPELINQEWQQKVSAMAIQPIPNAISNENIATHYIYKFFLQAIDDLDVLSKVKIAVVAVMVNSYMGNDSWTIHLWSKETEHSQYNMDRFKRLLVSADCLSTNNLKKLLQL